MCLAEYCKCGLQGEEVRLEDDWIPMDETMDPEEIEKSLRKKEAQSRAVVLEMVSTFIQE